MKGELSKKAIHKDPYDQFRHWLDEALASEVPGPTDMVLATVGKDNVPTTRIVLLKQFDRNGFVFFTNFESRKAIQIAENDHASLLFFWRDLERQVRVEGNIRKTDDDLSDKYFKSRPLKSRISAVISDQSSSVPDRKYLEQRFEEYQKDFTEDEILRPDFWGGYILEPVYFEFFQGRENRLHDRICFSQTKQGWTLDRLAP